MPTALPRTHLTHTPPVQRALAKAAIRWPAARTDSARLHQIIQEWEQLDLETADQAVAATAGKYHGVFKPGYLSDLRREWPER